MATLPARVVSAIVTTNSHLQQRLQSGSESDMGSLSVWHWLLFLAVALLMFGGSGKISSIMGDVAKGI